MKKIFPLVKSLKINTGNYCVPEVFKCYFKENKKNVFFDFKHPYEIANNLVSANVLFEFDSNILNDGYKLNLVNDLVYISYNSESGAYYALKTFAQILENKVIPNLSIYDYPKLSVRGFMIDISRDKVMKLETILKLVDLMADLKMNQLQLYVEGFSYEYKSFKQFLEDDGYITIEEYLEVEKYCNERFIDLVPNQNGFGHMAKWLEKDEYKDLAVEEKGIYLWGRFRKPTTLNPLDERSIELVKKMYADMIPLFKSKYFNMNFDEPFELGHGKTKDLDIKTVYLDYTLKAYQEVKKYDKIPQIWGDVLIKHPEVWEKLPKDMIFIDWGYDAFHPFDKHAKKLKEKKVNFMLAPGTTSWCSFLGRFIDYYENIKNAVDACYTHEGMGVLLTDWGDFGHLQFLPITYAPLIYMGLYSWSDVCMNDVINYLNIYLKNDSIGNILVDLSNNYKYEKEHPGNGTKTFYTFMWATCSIFDTTSEKDALEYFKTKLGNSTLNYKTYLKFERYFDYNLNELENVILEDELIKEELKLGIEIIKMIQKLSVSFDNNIDVSKRIKLLDSILNQKEEFINRQSKMWLARNKKGGLDSSLSYIKAFMDFVLITKKYLKGEEI